MGTASAPRNRKKRRKRWRLTPRFWVIVGTAFFIYMSFSYVTNFVQIWRIEQQIRRIEEEISRAEARNEELRRELAYLQSDEYIERIAREELGLVRPGETAVIIATPDAEGN